MKTSDIVVARNFSSGKKFAVRNHLTRCVIVGLLFSTPKPAIGESWVADSPSGQHFVCKSGAECAIQQYISIYGPTSDAFTCNNNYTYFGILTIISCVTHPIPTNPVYTLSGHGSIRCDDDEIGSASGCIPNTDRRPPPGCENLAGDPVNIKEGVLYEEKIDYSIGSEKPLLFKRYYWSDGVKEGGPTSYSRMGSNWRSNFDVAVWYAGTLPSVNRMVVTTQDGRQILFWYDNNNSVFIPISSSDRNYKLVYLSGNLIFTDESGSVYTFNSSNQLVNIAHMGGYTQGLTYTGNLNTRITDNIGRSIDLDYDASGLLKQISSNGNALVQYEYKNINPIQPSSQAYGSVVDSAAPSAFIISSVKWPQGIVGSNQIYYQYNNARWPYMLTGLVDERGVLASTWAYDATGRVAINQLAGGVGTFSFDYDLTNRTTTVTNPLGKKAVYSNITSDQNPTLLTGIVGQASTNCAASNSSFTYNPEGFRSSVTDEEGRKTIYTRDGQGRPTSITRGAP